MVSSEFISLIRLIESPSDYHEKSVRVIGFAAVDFEGKALYVSKDDLENSITKNAIWLEVEINAETRDLDSKCCLVEGEFDMTHKGHLKMYSGCIRVVKRFEVWTEPAG